MKSILDPSFRYIASFDTDVRKTFARVLREQTKESSQPNAETLVKVSAIVANAAAVRQGS